MTSLTTLDVAIVCLKLAGIGHGANGFAGIGHGARRIPSLWPIPANPPAPWPIPARHSSATNVPMKHSREDDAQRFPNGAVWPHPQRALNLSHSLWNLQLSSAFWTRQRN